MTPALAQESLAELVERQAGAHAGRECLSFGDGTTFRYGELPDLIARARGALAGSGVEPGDRVALMMRNSLFFPIAWLGVTTAAATAVPLNARYGSDDAGYVLEHSRASLVLCDTSTEPVVRDLADRLGLTVLAVEEGDHRPKLLEAADPTPPGPCTGSTLANIQYTSGTTGFPKGCLLTHTFWLRMGQVAVDLLRLSAGKRILTAQPFSYIDPIWNAVAALRSGAHLVMLDGFHPSTFMRDVATWRVNVFYCLGVMPSLLLKQSQPPWDRDHALERVFCSAIPPELHAEIEARWGVPWYEAFGMTETGINVAVSDEEHDELVGSGSLGRVLPHCEASVVDEEGRDLPPGQVGEMRLRGPGMMEGYLDDPEATEMFFRDGWANTGDLVTIDERGRLFFRGRRKEMIRRGGENVSQAEVEFALRAHPNVLDCAVAPVPDEAMGEEGKAYVVSVPGRQEDPKALHGFLAAKLARFKVPRYWEFRAELPRTPSERIAKGHLEEGRPSWRAGTYDATLEAWLEP